MGTQGTFQLQSCTRPFADDTAGKSELIRGSAETQLFPRALRTIQLSPFSHSLVLQVCDTLQKEENKKESHGIKK